MTSSSVTTPLVEEETPLLNMYTSNREHKSWPWISTGLGNKHYCAGEDQQQFIRPVDGLFCSMATVQCRISRQRCIISYPHEISVLSYFWGQTYMYIHSKHYYNKQTIYLFLYSLLQETHVKHVMSRSIDNSRVTICVETVTQKSVDLKHSLVLTGAFRLKPARPFLERY
jgi:hypothetical protein